MRTPKRRRRRRSLKVPPFRRLWRRKSVTTNKSALLWVDGAALPRDCGRGSGRSLVDAG